MRMLPRSRRLAVLTTAVVTAIALTLVPGAQATKGKSQGKGQSAPVASDTLLYRGATTVALDPDTAAALTSLGVSVAPTKPAKAGKNGISFPITLGVVNSTTLSGQIRHAGGLVFSKGETEVYLSRFFIDTDAGLRRHVGAGSLGPGRRGQVHRRPRRALQRRPQRGRHRARQALASGSPA